MQASKPMWVWTMSEPARTASKIGWAVEDMANEERLTKEHSSERSVD